MERVMHGVTVYGASTTKAVVVVMVPPSTTIRDTDRVVRHLGDTRDTHHHLTMAGVVVMICGADRVVTTGETTEAVVVGAGMGISGGNQGTINFKEKDEFYLFNIKTINYTGKTLVVK